MTAAHRRTAALHGEEAGTLMVALTLALALGQLSTQEYGRLSEDLARHGDCRRVRRAAFQNH